MNNDQVRQNTLTIIKCQNKFGNGHAMLCDKATSRNSADIKSVLCSGRPVIVSVDIAIVPVLLQLFSMSNRKMINTKQILCKNNFILNFALADKLRQL